MKKITRWTLGILIAMLTVCLFSCQVKEQKKEHEVVLELNGGTINGSSIQILEEGKAYELPEPSKTGYRFSGWYLSPDFSGSAISFVRPYESTTVYAKYEKIYKISYVTNGGESNNPTEITESESVVLQDAIRSGEFFAGWYSDSQFENRVYNISNANSDMVLYAKYYDKYRIIYDFDGGSQVSENPVFFASELGAHLYEATKPGYICTGWVNRAGDNLGFNIPTGIQEDYYVKATWEIATYSLTWETSGEMISNAPETYRFMEGVSADEFPIVSSNNKIFLYWYRIIDGVESKITNISANEYGDLVIYAKWYDEEHCTNNIWSKTVTDTKYTKSDIQRSGTPLTITVPEELSRYADDGHLRVRITATFTTKARSMGDATARAQAYFVVDGEKHLASTVSAKGGGYPAGGDTFGLFPIEGEFMANQGSVTVNVDIEDAEDSITLDCTYHMSSNKKSEKVLTDLYYNCDSLTYTFYVE